MGLWILKKSRNSLLFMLFFCPTCANASFYTTDKTVEYKSAKVVFQHNKITVSTGKIERVWKWTGKGLQTVSIKNQLTGKEYSKISGKYRCDWDLPGAINDTSQAELVDFSISENDDEGFTNKHLQVITTIKYPEARLEVQHVIWVFPNATGIRTQLRVKAFDGFSQKNLPDKEGERIDYGYKIAVPSARCEYLPLDFTVENARRYWGYYNNPGGRHDPGREMLEETIVKGYPLFLVEDNNWASGLSIEYNNGDQGVCVVKESPKCVNQQSHYTGSYYSGPDGLAVTGWGLTPDEIVTDRYRECWEEINGFYSFGGEGWRMKWQLDWVGGCMVTHPLSLIGQPISRERSFINYDMVITNGQAKSGFYYSCNNGKDWCSDCFSDPLPDNLLLLRKNADALYYFYKYCLSKKAIDPTWQRPESWKEPLRKFADAFVSLWNRYGQFGQHIDIETGEIRVGGTNSAAMTIGGLTLASQYENRPELLQVAKEASKSYSQGFVSLCPQILVKAGTSEFYTM